MRPLSRAARAYVLTGVVAATLLGPIGAAAAEPVPANVSVTITDGATSTPAPSTPSSSSGAPGSGGVGGSGSGGSVVTGGGTTTGGGIAPATQDEVSVAGMIYVGGLQAWTALSPNPGEGSVTLSFAVRNASGLPVDSSARFSIASAVFGNELDSTADVPITGLAPGETRVVTAQLDHAGQWTLLTARAVFTPPESLDGVTLEPVARDTLVVVFPWLGAVLLVAAVTGMILVPRALRAVRSPRAAVPSV